jgi:hypothetical protein
LTNLQRKADEAAQMFDLLVGMMKDEMKITRTNHYTRTEEIPSWL